MDTRASGENFAVVVRVLPRAAELRALYGYARLVDELGDSARGDRLAHLEWAETELDRAFAGRAAHPVFVRLTPVIAKRKLSRQPFSDLIAANRQDQMVSRYQTWEELAAYCQLSANPVGRLVLELFGAADPDRVALSDRVCTGLQLIEHIQDVVEDTLAGRVYLPADDMAAFGASERDLTASPPPSGARALIAWEVARARGLLAAAGELVSGLRLAPAALVASFAAGGLAAADDLARRGFDVSHPPKRPRRAGMARHWAALMNGRRQAR